MKLDVTEDRTIRIREAYNSVMFETKEGEQLVVCMRDGGFEIGTRDPNVKKGPYTWHGVHGGVIEVQNCTPSPKVDNPDGYTDCGCGC